MEHHRGRTKDGRIWVTVKNRRWLNLYIVVTFIFGLIFLCSDGAVLLLVQYFCSDCAVGAIAQNSYQSLLLYVVRFTVTFVRYFVGLDFDFVMNLQICK